MRLTSHFYGQWYFHHFIEWSDWGIGFSVMIHKPLKNLSIQLGPYYLDVGHRTPFPPPDGVKMADDFWPGQAGWSLSNNAED